MEKHELVLQKLTDYFLANSRTVYRPSDLVELLRQHRKEWGLPKSLTPPKFIDLLLRKTKLRAAKLRSETYPALTRYAWKGTFSEIELGFSIRRNGFLSHGSALWVHGISERPKEIYVNQEQSAKPTTNGGLTQESIDRAFRSHQRESKLIYTLGHTVIKILAGKHTGKMEVAQHVTPDGETVEVTSLDRTLIESVVRPAYAGGIPNVLRVFRSLREPISIDKLLDVLAKFSYVYPYHQALGFYLQRSGYELEGLSAVHRLRSNFRFYLGHSMEEPSYDEYWNIYYPRSLDRITTR
jgi:hypothetical protein